MSSMESRIRAKRVRSPHSLVQVGAVTGATEAMEQVLSLVEKARSFHSCKTLATDVVKANTRKHRTVKLWTQCAEVVEKRDTLRKSVSRLNVPHIHLRFHKLPPLLQGQGPVNPLYFDNDGQPVFAHMVGDPHANKHLIRFPIALDHTTLRSQIGNSTTPPQTVLLKADTGANVNLMKRKTFDQLFGKAKDMLQLTPIRMENYGNTAVKVLGMFHVFLRWKDKVYKQLFYITDCDRSPNLLSRDACNTLGVLKPCYTVENSTKLDTKHEPSFLHQKMSGTEKKLSNNSTSRWSIEKAGHP